MRWAAGLRLGSIAGIDIVVDPSLFVIFLLILFALGTEVFPAWHPQWGIELCWLMAAGAAVLFFASVLAHELAHALVGRAHGVEVDRITLFIFGGVAQMRSEPQSWRAELAVAAVGPLSSLTLGVAFLVLALLAGGPLHADPKNPQAALAALGPLATLLLWLGPVNLMLGLFNLVPAFPLDGGRIVRAVMWGISGDLHLATRWASLSGQVLAWVLLWAGVLMILGLELPLLGGGWLNGLWLAFIGWYLNKAALLSYRQLLLRESLEHVPVRKLMLTRFKPVDPGTLVCTLIEDAVKVEGQRAFPVLAEGRLLGMVSLRDLQRCGRDQWHTTTVADMMTPAARLATIAPDEPALEALAILGRRDLGQLPVVQGNTLLGLVRREDIIKWLSMHAVSDAAKA